MADDKKVNEAAFLKNLNKKRKAAEAAAKAERPDGVLNDAAILTRLGMDAPNMSIALSGTVSKIQFGYAKQDTNRPYFRFAYSLTANSPHSGKGKGLIVSNYIELTEGKDKDGNVFRDEEQAFEQLFFEFQGLGEDTASWKDPFTEAVNAAKRFTAEKSPIQLMLSTFERKNGELGLNIRVANTEAPEDNSDLEDSEEEGEEEGSYDDWVGGWVTWTDDDGSVDILVKSYDEEQDAFFGIDEDKEEYGPAPTSQCEWAEDQREE